MHPRSTLNCSKTYPGYSPSGSAPLPLFSGFADRCSLCAATNPPSRMWYVFCHRSRLRDEGRTRAEISAKNVGRSGSRGAAPLERWGRFRSPSCTWEVSLGRVRDHAAVEAAVNWLVTGGCGFIGVALVRSLLNEGGHSVRVVDNLAVGTREDLGAVCEFGETYPADVGPMASGSPVELVVGDILDEELALRVCEGADVIVHLAANTGVAPSVEDPRADCLANVIGTLNYLEAARHRGGAEKRFVFASSGATVG